MPLRRTADEGRRVMAGRDYVRIDRGVLGLILVAGLGATLLVLSSLPPRSIVMATGPKGGAYAEVALRYREILGRAGIGVNLLPTAGNYENPERQHHPQGVA
jgi:TRAP-type uncharacterized transport system substrate-binding protein